MRNTGRRSRRPGWLRLRPTTLVTLAGTLALSTVIGLGLPAALPGAGAAGHLQGVATVGLAETSLSVSFHEHGLLPGTGWSGTVANGSEVVLNFSTAAPEFNSTLPAGRYTWTPVAPTGYVAPPTRTLVVARHPIVVQVPFHVVSGFAFVSVREHGLPVGDGWTVSVHGTDPTTDAYNATVSSTGPRIRLFVVDGAYTFAVHDGAGYTPSPSNGSLNVSGPATVHVRFRSTTYSVGFTETGLPKGTRWGVRIQGPVHGTGNQTQIERTVGTLVQFGLPNGTYGVWIYVPAGYNVTICRSTLSVVATPHTCGNTSRPVQVPTAVAGKGSPTSVGSVTVTGARLLLNLTFTPHTGGNTSVPDGGRSLPTAFVLAPGAGSVLVARPSGAPRAPSSSA